MRLIKRSALISWTRFKECRQLDVNDYVEWQITEEIHSLQKIVFVSHRWIISTHPDPDGSQLRELKQRLDVLSQQESVFEDAVIFYDYCSLIQRPRTTDEEFQFYRELASLEKISQESGKFIILSEGYIDYKNRAWCFFEAVTAHDNIHYYNDQSHIRDDVQFFRDCLANESLQISSYHLSYKPEPNEAEIIVTAFQHLQACRVTHAEDLPLIKQQLAVHFNNRQISAYGKLITALNKFCIVEFAIKVIGIEHEDVICKPFFDEPNWIRLPSIDERALVMGNRGGPSLFALPSEKWRELKLIATNGLNPYLRISLPGVTDLKSYLEGFKNCRDWKKYVVPPITSIVKGDHFPIIDYVIHTVLELPGGFFLSQDSLYLQLYLFPENDLRVQTQFLEQISTEESESEMRLALANDEQTYGSDHPMIAQDLKKLCEFLQNNERAVEAIPLIIRAIVILVHYQNSIGQQHPDIDATVGDYREMARDIGWSDSQAMIELSKALSTP